MLPAEPVVGRTPNLVRYLAESTGATSEDGQIIDRARGVMLGVAVGNLLGLPGGRLVRATNKRALTRTV